MSLLKIPNDVLIQGTLSVSGSGSGINIPAGTVTDATVNAAAAIQATKLTHDHLRGRAQPNTAASSETIPIFVARNAGSVIEIAAGSIAAAVGAATVTIDLKKNGASILTAVITLDNANTARVLELGSLSSTTYAAGDFFELVITATAGGGTLPTGLYVQVLFREVGAA